MQFIKTINDLIYQKKRVIRAFLEEYSEEVVVVSDPCKAIKSHKEFDVEKGPKWIISKRSILILSSTMLKCGNYRIDLKDVHAAEMQIFGELSMVLKIETMDGEFYQFGLMFNDEWLNQNTLDLTVSEKKIKYSFFSIILRVLALGYIIYLFAS